MDGSIRADFNPELLAAALINLVNAVNSRFALRGSLIGDTYGNPAEKIFQEIYLVFLLGIQPPGKLTH